MSLSLILLYQRFRSNDVIVLLAEKAPAITLPFKGSVWLNPSFKEAKV
ncbi:3754_t:CDS:2, partial [Dentiscutata heterogama]